MKKRFKPTIAAFLILLILLVYANYYEVEVVLEPGREKPQRLIEADAEMIDSLTWKSGEKDTLKLEKSGKGFKISLPGNYEVDNEEVAGILSHFAELKSEMVVAKNATDTAAFGITDQSPRVVITSANKSWDLLLGSKSPVGGSNYLAFKDKASVYMVPGYIRGDFYKSVDNVRNRTLFPENFGNVVQIEIAEEGSAINLEKKEAIEWFIEEPVKLSAEAETVVRMIQLVQNLKISRFVEDDNLKAKEYGFASQGLRISLTNASGKTFKLDAGEVAGTETYVSVKGQPAIHAILNSDVQGFLMSVNDLRSKSLVEIEKAKLESIVLKDASGTVELVKTEGKWKFANKIIADNIIKAFRNDYSNVKIREFVSLDQEDSHGFKDLEKCGSFEFKGKDFSHKYLLGTVQGINLSLLKDDEIFVVTAELANSFKDFAQRVRAAVVEKAVVSGDSK